MHAASSSLALATDASSTDDGLTGSFSPASMIWRVNRELALLLGAGRALLLQLAHPLVAAGVADHSRFAADPVGRLARTLEPMYALVFGGPAAAGAAAERLRVAHNRVRGVLREPVGVYAAGTPYDAADPALRLWVHATLVDTSLVVYRRFVRSLPPAEEARYYADSRVLGRLLDVPEAAMPETMEAFGAYMAGMLAGEALAVSATTRRLARLVFHPPAAPSLRAIGPLAEILTVGLLPARIRCLYGYRWSPARDRALQTLAGCVRRVLPALPAPIRLVPQARAAERGRRLPGV